MTDEFWEWYNFSRVRSIRAEADNLDLFAMKAASKASALRQEARELEAKLYPSKRTIEYVAVPARVEPPGSHLGVHTASHLGAHTVPHLGVHTASHLGAHTAPRLGDLRPVDIPGISINQ